ncbi:uncharacterized protein LOC115232346 [Argonauta hians]
MYADMATAKRRENFARNPTIDSEFKESLVYNIQSMEDHEVSRSIIVSEPVSSYISLEVLAQVAAQKLQHHQKLQNKVKLKKTSKRNVQCLDILNLQQIQTLSETNLLRLFSDITCNEMTRNFTYQCYLMPEKCCEKFTSFGNEAKAKRYMKQHLVDHIEQLLYEAKDPERKYQVIFTAEPVHVQKRKLSEEKVKKKRSSMVNNNNISCNWNTKTFTNLKTTKDICRENQMPIQSKKIVSESRTLRSSKQNNKNSNIDEHDNNYNDFSGKEKRFCKKSVKDFKCEEKFVTKSDLKKPSSKLKKPSKCKKKKKREMKPKIVCSPPGLLLSTKDKLDLKNLQTHESIKSKAEKCHLFPAEIKTDQEEEIVSMLLKRTQPFLDHSYTSVFGKKCLVETCCVYSDNEEDNSRNCSTHVEKSKPLVPISEFKYRDHDDDDNDDALSVASEEIVTSSFLDEGHCGQKPYPPMPKSALARKGKLQVPEEEESLSGGEVEDCSPCSKRKRKDASKNTAAESERKTALRCIRELKGHKKDDKTSLACQICSDKTFTAAATLMHHYRSHAGIKPYVCLLCNTTFTRQHSLNYHMLIHNNQSRFTCKDCGRKFRHPSHFKEHLRRHTGETPFECNDCLQRFKTRNTYKRHLKTRHGKLLTATGIHVLSKEEFMKVRTKPYKKYYTLKNTESATDELLNSQPVDPSVCNSVPETTPISTTSNNTSTTTTNTNTTTITTITNTVDKPAASIINSTDKSFYIPFEISVNS